jgi:hypothetical protein
VGSRYPKSSRSFNLTGNPMGIKIFGFRDLFEASAMDFSMKSLLQRIAFARVPGLLFEQNWD